MKNARLKESILLSLLLEAEEVEQAEAASDAAESGVNAILAQVLADLESEAGEQERERVDEAGVTLVAGAALALPVIMKGIAKLGALFSKAMPTATDASEGWENWWSEKADDLHHVYLGACEKIVDAAIRVAEHASAGRYKGPGPEARKRAANVLFMAIIGVMAASAGMGVANALAGKSYAVAGTETLLGGIKVGEIQVLAGELLAEILGFEAAAGLASAAGVAGSTIGLG